MASCGRVKLDDKTVAMIDAIIRSNVFRAGTRNGTESFEDMVSEGWTKIMRVLPRYRKKKGQSLRSFVWIHSRYVVHDYLRYHGDKYRMKSVNSRGSARRERLPITKVDWECARKERIDMTDNQGHEIEFREKIEHLRHRIETCERLIPSQRRIMRNLVDMASNGTYTKQADAGRRAGVSDSYICLIRKAMAREWKHLNNGCCTENGRQS